MFITSIIEVVITCLLVCLFFIRIMSILMEKIMIYVMGIYKLVHFGTYPNKNANLVHLNVVL